MHNTHETHPINIAVEKNVVARISTFESYTKDYETAMLELDIHIFFQVRESLTKMITYYK